jgi:hypothetical protein
MNAPVAASVVASGVAVFTAVAAMFAAVYKRGQHEGRLAEILSRLTAMAADHEARLRVLESHRCGTNDRTGESPSQGPVIEL